MTSVARTLCCVPFCRRSRGLRKGETSPPSEWICGEHWKRVPRRLKATRTRLRRRAARHGWNDTTRLIDDRAWVLCKRAAIEAGVGLS